MASTTTAKPNARQLRQQARELGVHDWESMDSAALAKAVAAATKSAKTAAPKASTNGKAKTTARTRKAATTKAKADSRTRAPARAPARSTTKPKTAKPKTKDTTRAVRKPAPAPPLRREGPNPYRPGTNMYLIAEQLMKGGKRSTLVKRLLPKLEYRPRKKKWAEFDVYEETDRRLKIVGYNLRDEYGFEYIHLDRGPDAFIQVIPPAKPVRYPKS